MARYSLITTVWEFKNLGVPDFLAKLIHTEIRSIVDIVKFNEKHARYAMPEPHKDQDELIRAMNDASLKANIELYRTKLRKLAREILDNVFDKQSVDLIVAPADSAICVHAAAAGYPMGVVPLGTLDYNGRPFGMCMIAKAYEEEKILGFMDAHEKAFPSANCAEPKYLTSVMKKIIGLDR